jgi:hypothetical protein
MGLTRKAQLTVVFCLIVELRHPEQRKGSGFNTSMDHGPDPSLILRMTHLPMVPVFLPIFIGRPSTPFAPVSLPIFIGRPSTQKNTEQLPYGVIGCVLESIAAR